MVKKKRKKKFIFNLSFYFLIFSVPTNLTRNLPSAESKRPKDADVFISVVNNTEDCADCILKNIVPTSPMMLAEPNVSAR